MFSSISGVTSAASPRRPEELGPIAGGELPSRESDVSSVGSRTPGHLDQEEVDSEVEDEVEDDAASVTGESLSET